MILSDEDAISRCIVYAKAFSGDIHVNEHLFIFGEAKDDGRAHESAVLRSIASSDAAVHLIGCDIARTQNESRGNPESGPKRRYYCGFRTARVSKLVLNGDKYSITYIHDGVPDASHVDVALLVDSTLRNERKNIKAEAGLALAEAFGPATPHICEVDKDDPNHPLNKDPDCLVAGLPQFAVGADNDNSQGDTELATTR